MPGLGTGAIDSSMAHSLWISRCAASSCFTSTKQHTGLLARAETWAVVSFGGCPHPLSTGNGIVAQSIIDPVQGRYLHVRNRVLTLVERYPLKEKNQPNSGADSSGGDLVAFIGEEQIATLLQAPNFGNIRLVSLHIDNILCKFREKIRLETKFDGHTVSSLRGCP